MTARITASNRARVRLLALSTSAMTLFMSDVALAEDHPATRNHATAPDIAVPPDASGTPSGTAAQDTPIVVTAQRRTELLKDVPITIANVTPQRLEDTNTQSL